jgi:lipopolysaccharide export system protein LptA
MRRARWLILAAITIIILAVGSSYYGRLARMAKDTPAPPIPLRAGIDASAEGWHYRSYDEKRRGPNGEPCPVVEVMAKNFNQLKQPSSYLLDGVGLKFFHFCGQSFDEVTSAKASFDTASGVLFSEGEVQITKGRQSESEDAPTARLVKIVSSGVTYETKTGKVSTDKPASFTFENGDGKAVGADYDPTNHQLHMKSQVELNWRGKDGKAEPMKVESGDLLYFENLGKVALSPWGRLTRGPMKVEGGNSWVTLDGQTVQLVESEKAHGTQDDDDRHVEYSADHMVMQFNDDGQVSKITGDQNAHAISTSDTGQMDVRSDHIELLLIATDKDSVLDKAIALGHGVVQSKPVVKGTEPPADTRILKSEAIEVRMRPGGREIDNVETHAPGSLEFIPNRPAAPHRWLNGEKFWITYGDDNQIQSFRTVKAKTRTENPPKSGKPQPPAETWSDEFKAEFDPGSNQVARIEQTSNFRYQAGDRKAQSDRALLDQKSDKITLTGTARVTDPTGSATADRIVMEQKTGDFTAEGHVTSTRMPDKGDSPSAMLSNAEPMQATARKMVSTDSNLTIRYEGNAVAWQGANRIQADCLDIDRDDEVMHAQGNVISQFVDKAKKGKDGKPQPQTQTVFTIVKAPEMVYTEEERLAVYKGGATMTRPNMTVKGREIKAYLKDEQSDSSLDHAFADGGVVVVQSAKGRIRTGTAEHAEYYAGEEKVIMTGGQPKFVDSLKGTTTGRVLTYYTNDDRLLVNGVDAQRSESLLHRK